ncbi:MAG: hypothetical protein AAGJ29_12570 [Pseudomonadota bacterium]
MIFEQASEKDVARPHDVELQDASPMAIGFVDGVERGGTLEFGQILRGFSSLSRFRFGFERELTD